MESSRKTYSDESQNTIRMQRQQIDKIKKDKCVLRVQICIFRERLCDAMSGYVEACAFQAHDHLIFFFFVSLFYSDRLKEDLALETRQAKQANNLSASAQIAKLQDQVRMPSLVLCSPIHPLCCPRAFSLVPLS
jgi:hypothetical protein